MSLISEIIARVKSGQTPRQAFLSEMQERRRSVKAPSTSKSNGGSSSSPPSLGRIPSGHGVVVVESDKVITPTFKPPTFQQEMPSGGTSTPERLSGPVVIQPDAPGAPSIVVKRDTSIAPSKKVQQQYQKKQVELHATELGKQAGIQKYMFDVSTGLSSGQAEWRKHGQKLIDFDPKDPVMIKGVQYSGSDVVHTVSDFQSGFLPGSIGKVGSSMVLTPYEADIYFKNLGKSYIKKAETEFTGEYDPQKHFKSGVEAQKEWHPETKFYEYDPFYLHVGEEGKLIAGKTEGVTEIGTTKVHVQFPIFGGEKYTYLKGLLESDPLHGAELGLGWGGLGNVDIAFYKLTGQQQKAIDKQVSQLARYKLAKETLASGDVLGFSGHYWSGYFDSPATQIGLVYAGGTIIPKVTSFVSGLAASKLGVAGSLVVKGSALSMGGYLVGTQAINIKNLWAQGKEGEAVGRAWLFGSQIAAGYLGYKHAGGRLGMKTMEQRGYQRGTQFDKTVFSKYTPQSVKNIYGRLSGEVGKFKVKGILAREHSADVLRMMDTDELLFAKAIKYGVRKGRGSFFQTKAGKEGIISLKTGKDGMMIRATAVDEAFYSPTTKSISHLNIARGMVSDREGITSLQQIMGKRPDPFVSYKATDIWGMSWDAYRTTMPQLTGKTIVGDITYKIDYGKGLTYKGTTGERGIIQIKKWDNMFAESPYSSKHPMRGRPTETSLFPKEYRICKIELHDIKTGKTPFPIIKPKGVETISDARTVLKLDTRNMGFVSSRRAFDTYTALLKKTVVRQADLRFLNYLESLDPMYKPTTSMLAPVHIRRGMDIRMPTMKTMGGVTIFDADLLLGDRSRMVPDFKTDVTPKIKIKPIVFETRQKGLTKTDYKQGLDTGLKVGMTFDTAMLTGVKTDQLLGQIQETVPVNIFESLHVFQSPPKHTDVGGFPVIDILQPHYPTKHIPVKLPDFFGIPFDKSLYGGGRAAGGMGFFDTSKKFRKGELDMIFGIEV